MVERIGWSLNVQFALGTAFPRIAADGVTNERARLEVDGVPPESIWRLSFMQALVVRPGTLRDLPGASVSALRRLRTLRVSRNRLVSLPSSIASLESLEGLFVDGNALAGLPDEVGRLGALRTLEAHDNSLAALPPGLCDATALCRLTLRNNLLAALPGALGRLRRLSLLDVENNRLASLPESLAEIPALRELRLAGNRVTRLPAGLGATPLEKLFAQDNDLRRVDGLGASLRALNLENGPDKPGRRGGTNALSSLPPLGELTRLGVLFVAGLGLADLPDLSPLASLRVLLAAAKFVLSPVGAGFDCYRTWEGLFFGAIVIAQRCPLEREFNAAKLPVVFVDDFRFQQADLDRWAADHAPITSPDDPRLKRDAYLPPPE